MSSKILSFGIIASIIFLFFFWYPVILNVDKPISDHNDITYQYFIFDNNFSKLARFDFANLFDTRMFYPKTNTLAFGNTFLGQSIISLSVYIATRNIIVTVNFSLLLGFFLSFLSVYLLAYKLTKSISGALAAGLIYTYNPYVFAHNQIELLTLQWIPLAFLSAELILEKVTWRRSFLLSLLLFLQLTSSFYYFLFIMITLPIYAFLRIFMLKISFRKFLHPSIFASTILLVIAAYIFLQPYFQFQKEYHFTRSLYSNELYSAGFSDFFATSPNNFLYGSLEKSQVFQAWRNLFAREHYTEHSLFGGITVYLLVITALLLTVIKKNNKALTKTAVPLFVLLVLSIALSLGPMIRFMGINLPSAYLLVYRFMPFATALRVPSRFMVIGFLSMAILSGIALSYLVSKAGKFKFYLAALVVVLVALEYWQVQPVSHGINPHVRQFYSWLNSRSDIKVILEMPIGNQLTFNPALSRPFISDSQYLLYGIYHDKKIVNGYNAFIPPDYVFFADSLTVNPVTPDTIKSLKAKGIGLVIVHSEEYIDPKSGQTLVRNLEKSGAEKIYDSAPITAFKIN